MKMRRRDLLLPVVLLLISLAPKLHGQSWDERLRERGFIDMQLFDPTIRVQLAYADTANFMGKKLYHGLTRAWLHPDAARKLAKAQLLLIRHHPGHYLLIYDASRPIQVQRQMWELVRGTSKSWYVSNPTKSQGRHNYGMAVDVTLVDASGQPLPMGSPFDFFGESSHTNNEESLVKQGIIMEQELTNRRLLRRVMREAGFTTITTEWWHFNACSGGEAKANYRLIE